VSSSQGDATARAVPAVERAVVEERMNPRLRMRAENSASRVLEAGGSPVISPPDAPSAEAEGGWQPLSQSDGSDQPRPTTPEESRDRVGVVTFGRPRSRDGCAR